MNKLLPFLATAFFAFFLSGCLVQPVSQSGGMGSVTVSNSTPDAIISALQQVFPEYGYTLHSVHYPTSVTFDQGSSKIANVLWGSYGQPQTLRVHVNIIPIPGGSNYRLSPKVYTVTSAGEAGFESKRPLVGLWNSQFSPLLKRVSTQASGSGGL